jgi:hypothetical protein
MALSLRGNADIMGAIPESTGNLKYLMIFDVGDHVISICNATS